MVILSALYLGSVAVTGAADVHPDQPGPYTYSKSFISLYDESRDRSMDLTVFWPESEEIAGFPGFPLVVFNHGFLLSAEGYLSYGRHLASHGFVVAMPSFPISFLNVNHANLAINVRFVIDYCLGANQEPEHTMFGLIDPSRIGVSGHSLGGKLSLLEAAEDERIGVAALLDPVDAGNPLFEDPVRYPSVTPELMPNLEIPIMLIGAELGSIPAVFTPCAPEDENYQRFFEAANPPAIEITQLDVGHDQYVDDSVDGSASVCALGDVPGAWVRDNSAFYITAFFLGYLYNSQEALALLDATLTSQEQDGRISIRRK
jgi:hypothetical protein